jgi:hypothetical protein
MNRYLTIGLAYALIGLGSAWAHGERPRVTHLAFSSAHPDSVFALTSTQGIFANLKAEFSWLCEDAVYAGAATRGIVVSGEMSQRWLMANTNGLFKSTDRGCTFERAHDPISSHEFVGLWTHRDSPVIFTASQSQLRQNNVFRSHDSGETWQALGLDTDGAVRALHWSHTDVNRLYVHHRFGMKRSADLGDTFTAFAMVVGAQTIPSMLVHELVLSPTDADVLLAVVDSGNERSRILRSNDGGRTWSDGGLIPATGLTTVFHTNGRHVLSVSPFGAIWRSRDAGASWDAGSMTVTAMGCLRMKPGSDVLFGCSDPNAGGPWVIGKSEDFGETWVPLMTNFEDATHRDDCPPTSQSTVCCRGLCPGAQAAGMCGQPDLGPSAARCRQGPDAQVLAADAQVIPRDTGPMDSGLADVSARPDSTPVNRLYDARVIVDHAITQEITDTGPQRPRKAESGCHTVGLSDHGAMSLFYLVILMAVLRVRRS